MDGIETPQLYIGKKESKTDRPLKELKSFSKVFLKAGETKKVFLSVPKKNLAYYEIQTDSWVVEDGIYEFLVGASSRNIKLKNEIKIN
jgi:beta-glucosidase